MLWLLREWLGFEIWNIDGGCKFGVNCICIWEFVIVFGFGFVWDWVYFMVKWMGGDDSDEREVMVLFEVVEVD